jgi:poly(3-hydroxybutyrate) depolymerase
MLLPLLMALAAPIRSRAARGLAYGPGARQTVEVHAPVGADGEAPVVVMFKPCDRRAGQILAAHGLVVVVAGVGADWGRPEALEDAARACAWAREHAAGYGGDPARLFVFGHAEGGGVAARLALEPRWLASVGLEGVLRGAVGVLGLYELGGEGAPQVRSDAPPMLLLGGRKDGGERDRSTCALAERLRAAGAEVAEIRVPGLEPAPVHRLADSLRQRLMALDEIERFIRLRSLELRVS